MKLKSFNVKKKIESISGVLVEAMRKGHWIILDELNLAPTDVLEALNRVMSTILQSAYRSKRPSTGYCLQYLNLLIGLRGPQQGNFWNIPF